MIELVNITKIFPDGAEAVCDVNLEVKRGELCVLLGPSGCGKTTTMRMINQLILPTRGKIYIDGVLNIEIPENELRRNIGYAIQDIGLFPHMTVAENIGIVPTLRGWSKEERRTRAQELLELLRMDPDIFLDKYPASLSGGQRQRVGVARALGVDPPILLMDEPFGAIDPITRVELQNEFLRIQEEIRKTIIFVTHDIHEAIKMGDRIAIMNNGRLMQYGAPVELVFRPKNDFVADFIGSDRALKGLMLIHAKEVMRRSPPAVRTYETVESIEARMDQWELDFLPVIDDDGKLLGWIFESDLQRGGTIENIITVSNITAPENAVLSEALSTMLTSTVTVLGIVDQHGRLKGVLSFETIQEALRNTAREDAEG